MFRAKSARPVDAVLRATERVLPIDALVLVLESFPLSYLAHLKRISSAWASAVRRVAAQPKRAAEVARVPPRFATYETHVAAYASFITNKADKPQKPRVAKLLQKVQKVFSPSIMRTFRHYDIVLSTAFRPAEIFQECVESYVEGVSGRMFFFSDQYGTNDNALDAAALQLVLAGFDVYAFAKKYTGPNELAPGYSGGHYRWSIAGLCFQPAPGS